MRNIVKSALVAGAVAVVMVSCGEGFRSLKLLKSDNPIPEDNPQINYQEVKKKAIEIADGYTSDFFNGRMNGSAQLGNQIFALEVKVNNANSFTTELLGSGCTTLASFSSGQTNVTNNQEIRLGSASGFEARLTCVDPECVYSVARITRDFGSDITSADRYGTILSLLVKTQRSDNSVSLVSVNDNSIGDTRFKQYSSVVSQKQLCNNGDPGFVPPVNNTPEVQNPAPQFPFVDPNAGNPGSQQQQGGAINTIDPLLGTTPVTNPAPTVNNNGSFSNDQGGTIQEIFNGPQNNEPSVNPQDNNPSNPPQEDEGFIEDIFGNIFT